MNGAAGRGGAEARGGTGGGERGTVGHGGTAGDARPIRQDIVTTSDEGVEGTRPDSHLFGQASRAWTAPKRAQSGKLQLCKKRQVPVQLPKEKGTQWFGETLGFRPCVEVTSIQSSLSNLSQSSDRRARCRALSS
jgi:hypothetical protein